MASLRLVLHRVEYQMSHIAREMWSPRSYLAFIPIPPGQAWLMPCPEGCHVGDLVPSAGWESHRAISTRGHSAISLLQHCSMFPEAKVALQPWFRLLHIHHQHFPPRHPWHDESNALSTPSPIKEGFMLLALSALINNSHLGREVVCSGQRDVALPKGMDSVAFLRHCAGFLSSWGNNYNSGFTSKGPLLKKLSLQLLTHLAENAMPLWMNISIFSPERQGEEQISRGLLFLRC